MPIPDSAHAVSVCLPTWADVVGYEEKDGRILAKMQTGYPRFFLHPLINQVRARLPAKAGQEVLPFASAVAARQCAAMTGGQAQQVEGLWAAYFPTEVLAVARAYWQHTGRILSSRAAEDWLTSGRLQPKDDALDQVMRERLAGWSGAPASRISLHPSGMAAIYSAFEAVTLRRQGRRNVMFGFPYTDTLKILEKFGVGVEFLPQGDQSDLERLKRLLQTESIAGIFCEFPSNPLLQVPHLPHLHALAAAHGVPVIVDDTIGTFHNVNILPHADLIATSLTKAISGEGDVMAGSLVINPSGLLADQPTPGRDSGLYAADLKVLERNSRDFPTRMLQANANAERLARFLADHPTIEEVFYPGLDPSTVYQDLQKPGGGFGAVLSFLPHQGATSTPHIFERLNLSRGISLGTHYSLVCPYVQLAHYHELDWARSCGIDPFLLRISVGSEPWPTLKERFTRALS